MDSKLLLEIRCAQPPWDRPAAAFLHRLGEKHDVSDAEFLVDAVGYLTALFRRGLSGQLECLERNTIEKWFQTLSMRIDRFPSNWRGSPKSARRWLQRSRHHYNHDRPTQALDGRSSVEEVLNLTVPTAPYSIFTDILIFERERQEIYYNQEFILLACGGEQFSKIEQQRTAR